MRHRCLVESRLYSDALRLNRLPLAFGLTPWGASSWFFHAFPTNCRSSTSQMNVLDFIAVTEIYLDHVFQLPAAWSECVRSFVCFTLEQRAQRRCIRALTGSYSQWFLRRFLRIKSTSQAMSQIVQQLLKQTVRPETTGNTTR